LPVSHTIGEVNGYTPSRCSVNAVTPDSGAKLGKFHQPALNGRCFAFHASIDVFSSGSPRSLGSRDWGLGTGE